MSADIEVMVDAAERLKNGHTVNGVVQPLLTDLYQITMAYAYWKAGKSNESAVFDVFFRKNPFNGEFTIFAGLEECLKYLKHFKFSQSDLDYLKTVLPSTIEDQFFDYLANVSGDQIILSAVPEGYAVFPREPLMRLEGPLPVVQLMETTLLNLVNYASLVTTNAVRFRLAAGRSIQLMEFGLRRAQGPDGGLSASKYAYMGGFDGTSNLLAGKLYGIPVKGTHAHAFIMSFSSCDQLTQTHLADRKTGKLTNFVDLVQKRQGQVANTLNLIQGEASDGELAAFISYAIAFPHGFLALVDTYDVIRSGFLNFCSVALALNDLGYRALGVRIDSGDLAYLSIMGHNLLSKIAKEFQLPWMNDLLIIASNDINEDTIISLNEQRHKINSFGIGTHLVTCQRQPALGCVYKLVEINSKPCIKLSLDIEKVTIPCKKQVYRLYGKEGFAMLDLMCRDDEPGPQMNQRVLCRHPFVEAKRCFATASRVEPLLKCWWSDGQVIQPLPTLHEIRNRVKHSVNMLRPDIRRHLNPTPYKVSVSEQLYSYMHQLWLERAPIGELS